MRNYLADYNLLAVSANAKETALNTEQTLDTSMLVAKGNVILLKPRREDNRNELTGKEEADTVYDLGALAEGTLEFEKAQAQHFGFGYAFAFGGRSASASASSRRRSAKASYWAFAQDTACSWLTAPASARTGSSVSRRNLSRNRSQSCMWISLRRCARNSAWSRNMTVMRLSVSISLASR